MSPAYLTYIVYSCVTLFKLSMNNLQRAANNFHLSFVAFVSSQYFSDFMARFKSMTVTVLLCPPRISHKFTPGANPVFRGERPATNRFFFFSDFMASLKIFPVTELFVKKVYFRHNTTC
jgi:hypothetical protein